MSHGTVRVQSPRGYPLRRDDPKTSLAEEPITASLWYDEVGNDIAWGLDARGQVKGAWAATSATVLTVGDNELGANGEGWGTRYRIETIGPFPVNRMIDGRPEPVRVVVDLKSSDGEDVFCRAILRPQNMFALFEGVDGWNQGIGMTNGTDWAACPLRRISRVAGVVTDLEDDFPLRGFLQLPPTLWGFERTAVDAGDRDTARLCCVDLWLGRMSDTTVVSLGGYTVYGAPHGLKDTASWPGPLP